MTRIENSRDLRLEIKRLHGVVQEQQQQLKNDLLEVREALKPENMILQFLSSITGLKIEGKEFFRDTIMHGMFTLFQRLAIKGEKKIEVGIYSIIDDLVEKIRKFLYRFTSHEAMRAGRKESHEDFIPGG